VLRREEIHPQTVVGTTVDVVTVALSADDPEIEGLGGSVSTAQLVTAWRPRSRKASVSIVDAARVE